GYCRNRGGGRGTCRTQFQQAAAVFRVAEPEPGHLQSAARIAPGRRENRYGIAPKDLSAPAQTGDAPKRRRLGSAGGIDVVRNHPRHYAGGRRGVRSGQLERRSKWGRFLCWSNGAWGVGDRWCDKYIPPLEV